MQKDLLEEFFNKFELHQPSPSGPVLNSLNSQEIWHFSMSNECNDNHY